MDDQHRSDLEKILSRLRAKPRIPDSASPTKCAHCGGTGYAVSPILRPDGRSYEGATPCHACSYWPTYYRSLANLDIYADCTLHNFQFTRLYAHLGEIEATQKALTLSHIVGLYTTALRTKIARGEGLYLYGDVGLGKTHMAAALIGMACDQCIAARRINEEDYMSHVRSGFGLPPGQAERHLSFYLDVPLLAIDEFLSSYYKDGAEGWASGEMARLIDHRYRHRLATIFTSNYSLEEAALSFRGGIGSRIFERCVPIRFHGGADHRTEQPSWKGRYDSLGLLNDPE